MNILLKHNNQPLTDLDIEFDIDAEQRLVTVRLDHFDSHLLIAFCRNVLEPAGVRVIDNISYRVTGVTPIEVRYGLRVQVFGTTLQAQIAQVNEHECTVHLSGSAI
ncbi:MAG TPA: hypothetical protein VF450_03425 [Noviherbaspirillum sp.]